MFQTLEGGLGFWAGNRFHSGAPKFSMNGTTDCYTNEVASPGWSFFRDSRPLPDDRLGIAQISNRLLIDATGRTTLVRDVTLYSKAALYDDVLAWRRGGEAPKGAFAAAGTARPKIATGRVGYRQDDKEIDGIHELAAFDRKLFVNPPKGMEVGFVPIVVRQELTAH